jgi:hypothetical protein
VVSVSGEQSPAEAAVDAVLEQHFGYDIEPDEGASLAATIVMAASLVEQHCHCPWCSGETTSDGDCACEFCQHRRANLCDTGHLFRGVGPCACGQMFAEPEVGT